jgi:hypothetical protein
MAHWKRLTSTDGPLRSITGGRLCLVGGSVAGQTIRNRSGQGGARASASTL